MAKPLPDVLDHLAMAAAAATFAGRAAPLPPSTRETLHEAAEAAFDLLDDTDGGRIDASLHYAAHLLVQAAFAACAYPDLEAPLAALRAARDLYALLRPEPEPEPRTYAERAGLQGGF